VIGSSPNTSVDKTNKRKKIVLRISILLFSFQASPQKRSNPNRIIKEFTLKTKFILFDHWKKRPGIIAGQKRR